MGKKIITRAERQAKLQANAVKLNNHINEGVKNYVQDTYNDSKEARKNARWYETGEALAEAKVQGQLDADQEFSNEFAVWAEKQQEEHYAELDASEAKLLEAEDVTDVEFTPIALPSSRGRRQSKLLGASSNSTLSLEGKVETPKQINPSAAKPNKFSAGDLPK